MIAGSALDQVRIPGNVNLTMSEGLQLALPRRGTGPQGGPALCAGSDSNDAARDVEGMAGHVSDQLSVAEMGASAYRDRPRNRRLSEAERHRVSSTTRRCSVQAGHTACFGKCASGVLKGFCGHAPGMGRFLACSTPHLRGRRSGGASPGLVYAVPCATSARRPPHS